MFSVLALCISSLLGPVEATDVGAAIAVHKRYRCVPYIRHPLEPSEPAYHVRTTWLPGKRTLQCYYGLEDGREYMAPEGRLVVDDDRACRYSEEEETLTCEGKFK